MQGQGSAVITEARLESRHLRNRGLDPLGTRNLSVPWRTFFCISLSIHPGVC